MAQLSIDFASESRSVRIVRLQEEVYGGFADTEPYFGERKRTGTQCCFVPRYNKSKRTIIE